jgi:hypothetical protein
MPLLGTALLIPALTLCVISSGCNKPTEKGAESKGGKTDKGTEAKATNAKPEGKITKTALTAAADGIVKGHVKLEGAAPTAEPIKEMAAHADKETCLAGSPAEKGKQEWLIGKDNGVANAIVFLVPPDDKSFDVDNAEVKKSLMTKAVLDQPHCAFVPHVLALYAAGKEGGVVEVKNSAPITHNTKVSGNALKNPLKEKNLPPKTHEDFPVKYQGKDPLTAVCSQHPWMNAIIFTFDQPYFAVTKDDGSFEMKHVPSGAELTVMVWHESFGPKLSDAKKMETKSFKTGENPDLVLKISK